MPWLCAKDVGPARRATKDVVGDDPPWDKNELVIEEHVHNKIEGL